MKKIVILLVVILIPAVVFCSDNTLVSNSSENLTNTPTAALTATSTPVPAWTATPLPAITISGTVNYQGSGNNNIYVFMTDNYGGYYLSPPLTNKGIYFFNESPNNIQGFVLWVCYDVTGNGIQLTPNYLGNGYPVQQGNAQSIEGSGDVVCSVGYRGSCMGMGPGGGTHYTTNTTVNIVFGGGAGFQSGTSCSN